MCKFIKIIQHPITNGYLNLDMRQTVEWLVNPANIIVKYDPKYPNGYGEYLHCLKIKDPNQTITLYREDADTAYKYLQKLNIKED